MTRFQLIGRWKRFWHCLFNTFNGRHRMETLSEGYGLFQYRTLELSCECGKTFWTRYGK